MRSARGPESSSRSRFSPTTAARSARRATRYALKQRAPDQLRRGCVNERPRERYLAAAGGRILNIPVPKTGHTPLSAGRPLAIFTCWAFEIFRFALHFTQ